MNAKLALAALIPGLLAATPGDSVRVAAPVAWHVDGAHTQVAFSTRHFFTPVRGSFQDYEIDLQFDPENPAASRVTARIAVASVNTANAKRDDDLRSADWFEAARHPHITFTSTSVRQVAPDRLVAAGELTIKGVTKEIELPITLLGIQDIPAPMQEMMGGARQVASFQTALKLDRREFGVGVGSWADTMIVGADVEVAIAVEAGRK